METLKGTHSRLNGIDLYHEEYIHPVSDKTIVLLHGFLASSFSYRKLIPYLMKDYHVITVDIPPFGKSGKSKGFRYSYENMAKTVAELIKSLDRENVFLAGHSMGGQIALNVVHQDPGLAQKVVLLCSSGYLERARRPLIWSSYIPMFDLYVKHYLGRTGVMGNLVNVVHDKELIDSPMVAGYMEPFRDRAIFAALSRMLRHREGDLPSHILKSIDTPCLLLWGEYDRIVPVSVGKRLAHDLPNSRLVILKNAGHLIPEEIPDEVSRHMRDFLLADN
ncbi:MAG TPA: alpha/beta hydrolase [Bacillaceae bacterium]